MDIWDKIVNFFNGAKKIVPVLVTVASVATAIIPNPTPEAAAALKLIHVVLDAVALNVGENTQVKDNV